MANVVTLRAFISYYLCTYTDFKKTPIIFKSITLCIFMYGKFDRNINFYSTYCHYRRNLFQFYWNRKQQFIIKIYSWLWFSIQHIIQICYISKHKFSSSWVKMLNIISSPYLYPINFNRNFILKTNQFLCILEVNLHNRTTFNLATFSGCLFIIFCIWILIEYQFNKI